MIAFLLLLPLILGIAMVFAGTAVLRWFVRASPKKLAGSMRSGRSFALVLLGIFLLMRGQVMLGGSLVMAGLGGLSGAAGGGAGGFGGPFGGLGGFGTRPGNSRKRSGQSSTVRTPNLEATLDHDSGEMDAKVLAGPFAGRRLSEMDEADVVGLWHDFADERDSRLVVEAYLDRRHPEWREDLERDHHRGAGGARGAGGGGAMTVQEAYEVLGLQAGAGEAEIRASHRRLMKQMHPDQGGSTYLAARLNEAKDILLRKR